MSFQGILGFRRKNAENGRIPERGRLGKEQPTRKPMSISQYDFQEVIESFCLIYGEKRAKAMENPSLRTGKLL
jgi:hypothetical protein